MTWLTLRAHPARWGLAGLLALTGCGESGPQQSPDAVPEDPKPVPEPPVLNRPTPVDPAAGGCHVSYTSTSSNAVFSAASAVESGACSFEGVRVAGVATTLRWSTPAGTELSWEMMPAACPPTGSLSRFEGGTEAGALRLAPLPAGIDACAPLATALPRALSSGAFPEPEAHEPDGLPGPDGRAEDAGPVRPPGPLPDVPLEEGVPVVNNVPVDNPVPATTAEPAEASGAAASATEQAASPPH